MRSLCPKRRRGGFRKRWSDCLNEVRYRQTATRGEAYWQRDKRNDEERLSTRLQNSSERATACRVVNARLHTGPIPIVIHKGRQTAAKRTRWAQRRICMTDCSSSAHLASSRRGHSGLGRHSPGLCATAGEASFAICHIWSRAMDAWCCDRCNLHLS